MKRLQLISANARRSPLLFLKAELPASAIVLAGFLVELHHIINSIWRDFFFSNSDMLTLPLVRQSILAHEPFHWIFSSQIFLFPESIFYAISALITPNFRLAVICNAFLNCVAFYLLMRWITWLITDSKLLSQMGGVVTLLILLTMTFLEDHTGTNLATFFLVTTAYYGVILASLTSIALSLQLLKSTTFSHRRLIVIGLFSITMLTSLSNPLYLFQFVAPLAAVLVFSLLLNGCSVRTAIIILLPQIFGGVLGNLGRKLFFTNFFSPLGKVDKYLHYDAAGMAARSLWAQVAQMVHGTWQQKIEICLLAFGVLAALVMLLVIVNLATRRKVPKPLRPLLTESAFILIAFGSLAPISVVLGSILTGNSVTRYLVPLIVFPLLALLPILSIEWVIKVPAMKLYKLLAVGAAIAVIIAGLTNPIRSVMAVSNYQSADSKCLDATLGNPPSRVGVAQYWRARDLQLNSRKDSTVIQTEPLLTRFTWLYNGADYQLYHPNFVIVDKPLMSKYSIEVSTSDSFTINAGNVITILGKPSSIASCPTMYVYTYNTDNPGRDLLYRRLNDSKLGL